MTKRRFLTAASLVVLLLLTVAFVAGANGRIAEPDANVLYQLDGEQPADAFGRMALRLTRNWAAAPV